MFLAAQGLVDLVLGARCTRGGRGVVSAGISAFPEAGKCMVIHCGIFDAKPLYRPSRYSGDSHYWQSQLAFG